MAKAVTLKNDNNEEVYPVTDISLVNGELNGARIVNASVGSDKLTPNAVWTENIKDGAVTSTKINWTTFKFPIPDYSNGTSISDSTNTWTATKCGVVVALLIADTTNGYKYATISVNDKTVATAFWAGLAGGYNFQTRAVIPVATGDVVKFSTADGNSKVQDRVFFPYKWVA